MSEHDEDMEKMPLRISTCIVVWLGYISFFSFLYVGVYTCVWSLELGVVRIDCILAETRRGKRMQEQKMQRKLLMVDRDRHCMFEGLRLGVVEYKYFGWSFEGHEY